MEEGLFFMGINMSAKKNLIVVSFITAVISLSACGGSSGSGASGGTGTEVPGENNNVETESIVQNQLPPGSIMQFGAVTIGDDAGVASDLVGGFFQLASGVDAGYFDSLRRPNSVNCAVDSDDNIDFEEISAGYIPSLNGVNKQSISAGETLILSSMEGTYAEMTQQPTGEFLLYNLPNGQSLPDAAIPQSLTVDIPGDEFPAFSAVPAPLVETLTGVSISTGDAVSSSSSFFWDAESSSESQVRIYSSTAGGFFLEDGMTVTCIVPDTGQFSFPADIREQLGADFSGGAPIMSRVSTHSEVTENSVLFVIRESGL